MKSLYISTICFLLLTCSVQGVSAQQLAFPGAEGFGRYTSGGRGGAVFEVTNLDDSGPGSLREGIEMEGPRTIVFRVSGTIHIKSELRIRNGDLTIAGQTAPGDGIALKGSGVVVDADNIIIRYIRFRPGDISGGEPDAIWGRNHSDIIIDHCSMSWAVDETSSFYDNENFTMQWCLLSESLYESQHEKGRHGYGGIWGGQGATFHHNILAHHSSRNPRFNGSRYSGEPELEIVDYRNNVIYNWGGNSAYGGENGNHNMVANYYKSGPATSGDKRFRILDASSVNSSDPVLGRWHVEDNFVEGYPDVSADNWSGGVQGLNASQLEEVRYEEPFPFAPVVTQTASEAYLSVLENAGATLPVRDPVDARIVQEIESGTVNYGGAYGEGKGIIDTQEQVGGWPELFAAPPPADADHDGMPDDWELENDLDPENAEDGKMIADNGYTHLENYINSIDGTEQDNFLKYPTAITVMDNSTSTISISWQDNEDDETSIILERSADNEVFEVAEVLPENTAAYVDEGLESGTEYYYRLKVANDADTSVYSQVLAATTSSIPAVPDQERLMGYYSFDVSSGVIVYDESTYENHGEVANTEDHNWTSGKVNNAIDLAAVTSSAHILVQHTDQNAFNDKAFTIAFWMKASEQPTHSYLFHKGTFAGIGKWYGLELKDGLIRFSVDDNSTKSEVSFDNSEFLSGEWVHVAAVRNRVDETLNIYKDGALVASAPDLTTGEIGQEEPLIIANSNDLNAPFSGMLDEFIMFDYSLNVAEISGLKTGIPQSVKDPFPANNATGIEHEEVNLTWSGDALSYNLYFGTSEADLALEADGLTSPSYTLSPLAENTTYYWKVDAVGSEGLASSGEVWSFSTDAITGLQESITRRELKLYPNPFSDILQAEFYLASPQPVTLSLYDMQTRLVYSGTNSTMEEGRHQVQIREIQELAEGVYFCILETATEKVVKRVILMKKQ